MSNNRFRFHAKTNVPGEIRVSGRITYTAAGGVNIVEGKLFQVTRTGAGAFTITAYPPVGETQFFKGLIAVNLEELTADPTGGAAANLRNAVWTGITTAGNGGVTGITLKTLDKTNAAADPADGDGFSFELTFRDTEILV